MKLDELRGLYREKKLPCDERSSMVDRVAAAAGAPRFGTKIGQPANCKCESCGWPEQDFEIRIGVDKPMKPRPVGSGEVLWESSRTAYHFEHGEEDPNKPIALCRTCARHHHEMWDEQWKEHGRALL